MTNARWQCARFMARRCHATVTLAQFSADRDAPHPLTRRGKSPRTGAVAIRARIVIGCVGALLCVSTSAIAQVFDSSGASYEPPEPERRFGFAMGLGVGAGFGSSLGYPNKLGEIDNPEFEQNVSGFAVTNSIWIGGAIRDWFTFGLGLSSRGAGEGDLIANNGAFVVHMEGFPLWALGGEWRDIGLYAETGAGVATIMTKDQEILADGGLMSVIGVGAFYEPWQFWHFSMGPALQYHHEFSQSLSSHVVSLGLRTAFYGVQPR